MRHYFLIYSSLFYLAILFWPQIGQARLLSYEVTSRQHKVFPLKEACKLSGHTNNLLVSADGPFKVNCMGRRLSTREFCRAQHKEQKFERPFLRSYIAGESDPAVFCVLGSAVRLTYSCESPDRREYCEDTKRSCEKLRQQLAEDLPLVYHTRVFDEDDEILHCHYIKELFSGDDEIDDALVIPPIIPAP